VICRLKGTYDKGSKSMEIREIETIKTNTPPDFENCHQSHQLTYLKQKDKETLIGKWKPSEKGSTCGKGFTELERKALVKENNNKSTTENNPAASKVTNPDKKPLTKTTSPKNNTTAPQVKTLPSPKQQPSKPSVATSKPVIKKPPITVEPKIIQEDVTPVVPPKIGQQSVRENLNEKKNSEKSALPIESAKAKNLSENTKDKLAKRTYQVIKVIEVLQPNIKVDIYDNGQVDGDVVSIYLNEKQLISSKMLTAQPITLQIKVDENEDVYDLIMYAESLGSIPPNTALMIVTTPTQRYEINISSNEQTSGAIRFKFKK
jgi:hypothetical protein